LVIIDVNGKQATRDVHMFGVNPKWYKNLHFWEESGAVTLGKDSKTVGGGPAMMFVG